MSDSPSNNTFCELLFTKPLAHYFRSVFNTNMDGFNSSTPNPGAWEVYVYDQSNFRSLAGRNIRSKFVTAVKALGQRLYALEKDNNLSQEVLDHIRAHGLTAEQEQHFNMFFNIVDDNKKDTEGKATSVSVKDYKNSQPEANRYRVNVKTFISGLDVSGAYSKNLSGQQGGAAPTQKLALITSFLPLVQPGDGLPVGASVLSESSAVGSGADEDRAAILRILCELQFETPDPPGSFSLDFIVPAQEVASYLACNPEPTRVPSVLSNTITLAALPTNSWRKLSDGSYEKLTPQGYQPLSREECEKLLQTCAGSTLNSTVCQKFMEAVNNQDEQTILKFLSSSSDVWDSNTAADSLSKLHPETVLKILKTLKFGTKNGPFGKRVCTVDEWVSECVKGTSYASAKLSPNMKSYLEHLVQFVNSNPSLIDPSKRSFAGRTFQNVPNVFTDRGLYYAGEDMHSTNNLLTFADVNRAIQQHQSGINLLNVLMQPTMAYGAVQPLRGGNPHIYTQPAQAQLSLGNGISQLLQQTLNGLRATSRGISQEDEAKIREKVARLTALEQEIYQTIMVLNEQRLAVESGVSCHSQLSSTQDRLMQLGSMYDRRVPCLQELCEQLRLLLAQQQNTTGCQPIE